MKPVTYLKIICIFSIFNLLCISIIVANSDNFGASDEITNHIIMEFPKIQFFDEGNLSSEFKATHDFNIIGDDDLVISAIEENWTGDGSDSNPFIIENYFITNFVIRDITHSLIIRNNLIGQLTLYGSNATIENNLVDDASPIWIEGSNNIIRNNQITGGEVHTIYLVGDNNLIESNTLVDTGTGLTVSGSDNVIYGNFLVLDITKLGDVFGDDISTRHGLLLDGSDNFVSVNTFSNAPGYGIMVGKGSEFNNITLNNFINNSLLVFEDMDPVSQVYDGNGLNYDSTATSNNYYDYNYWNDFVGPDEDENTIIDVPYDIGGVSEEDSFPLVYYVNMSLPSIVPPHHNFFGEDTIVEASDLDIQNTTTIDNVFEGQTAGPIPVNYGLVEEIGEEIEQDLEENLVISDSLYVIIFTPVIVLIVMSIYKYRRNLKSGIH